MKAKVCLDACYVFIMELAFIIKKRAEKSFWRSLIYLIRLKKS